MAQPAVIVDQAYDFTLWILNKVEGFPRSHRPLLGDRMVTASIDLLLLLVRAMYTANKAELLDRANLEINALRYLLRLAKDLKLLSIDSYEFAAKRGDEIGRMLGGWRKQVAART